MTTTTTERLRLDIHPAQVFARGAIDYEQTGARVFITDSRIIVWSRSATCLLDEPITGAVPQATRATLVGEMVVETAKGQVIISKGHGCGCGDPAKALTPPASR